MRLIDLINKQYCNEEMPKHIRINKLDYTYDNNRKTYKSKYGEFMSFDFTNNVLNMKVELIEDEIDSIEELDKCKFGHGNMISYQESKFIDKVNELVQAVKQLNKEIKSIKEK